MWYSLSAAGSGYGLDDGLYEDVRVNGTEDPSPYRYVSRIRVLVNEERDGNAVAEDVELLTLTKMTDTL